MASHYPSTHLEGLEDGRACGVEKAEGGAGLLERGAAGCEFKDDADGFAVRREVTWAGLAGTNCESAAPKAIQPLSGGLRNSGCQVRMPTVEGWPESERTWCSLAPARTPQAWLPQAEVPPPPLSPCMEPGSIHAPVACPDTGYSYMAALPAGRRRRSGSKGSGARSPQLPDSSGGEDRSVWFRVFFGMWGSCAAV